LFLLKNQEDEIIIQLDKVTQKPIIHLLKEMGVTDLEICQNLQNSEFFYFNNPILTHSIYQPNKLLRFNLNKNYYPPHYTFTYSDGFSTLEFSFVCECFNFL